MLTHPRQLRSIQRWVWSELHEHPDTGERHPVVADYCLLYDAPFHFRAYGHGEYALCYTEMLHDQWEAAQLDGRVFVLDDLHSHEPIPESMAIALGPLFGVSLKDTVREALVKLSGHHLHFLPHH